MKLRPDIYQRELLRRDLYEFVKAAWHVVEPAQPFRDNWHVEEICRSLEAVSKGWIQRLIINIPPGHAKSLIVSVLWPAWVWLRNPEWRVLSTSYVEKLTNRDSIRCRKVVSSGWYQSLIMLPNGERAWALQDDIDRQDHFANTRMGERMAIPFQSSTGFRGDCVIVDDPISATKALSELERDKVIETWRTAYPSRINDPETGAWVIIMQRLHEVDLTGHCLEVGGYEHLKLPARFKADERSEVRYQKGPHAGEVCARDRRTVDGEIIFPALYSEENLAKLEATLGPDGAAAQLSQDPAPKDGLLFRRSWWRFWNLTGVKSESSMARPKGCDDSPPLVPKTLKNPKVISLDSSFKGEARSDYCVITVWMRERDRVYLIDMRRGKWDVVQLEREFISVCKQYPEARVKLIEDSANGPALRAMIEGKVSGKVENVTPEGGKVARANAIQGKVYSGELVLPEGAPWLEDFVSEFAKFPKGKNDDIVDSTSQAIIWLSDSADAMALRALGTF